MILLRAVGFDVDCNDFPGETCVGPDSVLAAADPASFGNCWSSRPLALSTSVDAGLIGWWQSTGGGIEVCGPPGRVVLREAAGRLLNSQRRPSATHRLHGWRSPGLSGTQRDLRFRHCSHDWYARRLRDCGGESGRLMGRKLNWSVCPAGVGVLSSISLDVRLLLRLAGVVRWF